MEIVISVKAEKKLQGFGCQDSECDRHIGPTLGRKAILL